MGRSIGAARVSKRLHLPANALPSTSGPPKKMKTRAFSTGREARMARWAAAVV